MKREFVAGDLRNPRRAAMPILAALGGVAVLALVFVAFALRSGDGALNGWAIPTATDIAFAVAVLAVVNSHMPPALRTFLLTLAVVDDLLAVTIIAVFYTADLLLLPLLLAVVPLGLFTLAVQRRVTSWLLLPLAAATWTRVHASGVHATVARVLLGFAVPVSLLIGDLAYDGGGSLEDSVKVAILTGSVLAATLAALLARSRNRAYRSIAETETLDEDGDGIPDAYQATRGHT